MITISRRLLMTAGGAALAVGAAGGARAGVRPQDPLKIALLGQALIEHPLAGAQWPGRAAIAARLAASDVVFTNLETVIKGPRAQAPTRELLTLHAADPKVLATLADIGVNLLASANNHAFDLGTGGVLDTLAAMETAQLAFAGLGRDLASASGAGVLSHPKGQVALVAFATGKVREGGRAEADRPGVHEVRVDAQGSPLTEDVERLLSSIAAAARTARLVLVYQHDHLWEADNSQVASWRRTLARRCIDAGANLFVAHGAPLLQGVEVWRGAPIFYGLGNFIFQTEKPVGAYAPECWQSVIAEVSFDDGRCREVVFRPIVLNEVGLGGPDDMATRGAPSIAPAAAAGEILQRLSARSKTLGGQISPIEGGQARLLGLA